MSEKPGVSYGGWADALRSGTLLGVRCEECGALYATPVSVCHDCGGRTLESADLSNEGTLHSVTRIDVPPVGFEGPYYIGIVQLDTARITARIEADHTPEIEDRVVFSGVIEEDPNGLPAPVFTVDNR